jgi:transposase-like protein
MAKPEAFRKKRTSRAKRYFSESFKVKKVREIERNLTKVSEISREYEVSTTAIYKWLYKYSTFHKRQIRQVIEPMSDTKKIQELKAKIKELEQVVGQKQIQLEFKEKMIELAEQMYNIDIKKKLGTKPSSGSGSTDQNTEKK